MIDPKKVELMTGMAMYEHTKKTSFKQEKYFEKNFRFVIALRSIPFGAAIGVIVLCIIFAAVPGFFSFVYGKAGPAVFFLADIAAVMIITALYTAASVMILGKKFENMRGSYVKYRLYRNELRKIREEKQIRA